ncbi:sugar MFS transporter [Proteiniphilum sp. X52]|uniref:sugar MFS transporter n=1 Tax=Proteiniphilum sp. X52 TaxID=2382159 RepID=UPI000F0A3E0E|nr:sugar MFS transporter [Proteiniphilum sp. X52]RNC64670.1 glucose/galactose MFS transporter [Proteiniphilum sp. X52]
MNKKVFYISMGILAVMYFVIGLVSWVNAILIPYFKIALELTHFQSYFVTFAFYIAYFVMAVPSGLLLNRTGYKKGIMWGFLFLSLGALIFVPAALMRQYAVFLAGLYCLGTGLAILQTAANPYVTMIGPIDSAARRMSVMGIFNKSAGIIAPLLFAAVVFKSTDEGTFALLESGALSETEKNIILQELIRRVITPYSILALLLVLLGLGIRYSVLPEIEEKGDEAKEENGALTVVNTSKKSLLDYPYLVFGAIAIFLHVGTQVVAIDTIINYAGSMGIGLLDAKFFPSYTLLCTIIGYLLGILLIPRFVPQKRALQFCATLGLLLSFGVVLANQPVTLFGHTANISIWFLASIGFPNALIYAGIWPLSIHDLGKLTKTGSSLLIMGLSGNAILPLIYGAIGDHRGLRAGYWVLVPCFIYLVWFAFHGHTINDWKRGKRR